MSNLHVTSGDAYLGVRRLVVTVTDANGPVDLTGSVLTFMAKRRRGDADDDAVITVTPELASPQTGDTEGVAYIALTEDDTKDLSGRFVWELSGEDSVGTITLARGYLYITTDLIEGA